jgi:hypothetical protein
MKKNDVIKLFETIRLHNQNDPKGFVDDGKLHHDEVGERSHWVGRYFIPDVWPHSYSEKGLRLEIWFPMGNSKDEVFTLLCVVPERFDFAKDLTQNLITHGRYAKRYNALTKDQQSFMLSEVAVARTITAVEKKLFDAFQQLKVDVGALVEKQDLNSAQSTTEPVDPFALLKAKMGK